MLNFHNSFSMHISPCFRCLFDDNNKIKNDEKETKFMKCLGMVSMQDM